MMKVGTTHHILAYLAAAVSAVSVILAGISKLIGQTLGISTTSYMALATVAIVFAIYFLVEGAVYSANVSTSFTSATQTRKQFLVPLDDTFRRIGHQRFPRLPRPFHQAIPILKHSAQDCLPLIYRMTDTSATAVSKHLEIRWHG